jgi:hypothetical protein
MTFIVIIIIIIIDTANHNQVTIIQIDSIRPNTHS